MREVKVATKLVAILAVLTEEVFVELQRGWADAVSRFQ
jgi:hypothetical protein